MPIASPSNITTTTNMFTWINTVTDNWFFPGFIIAVYIISFIKMLSNENNTASKAFAASSFIAMIISVLARVLDFVSTGFMSLFIILTAVGAVWMHIENSGGQQ